MAKSAGIAKSLLSLTAAFSIDYLDEALLLAAAAQRLTEKELDNLARKILYPIFDAYFDEGVRASNLIIKKEVASLVDTIGVPYKYDRALIDTINGDSVFSGYYDRNYKNLYKAREIDALKRTILRGKYSDWTDKQLAAEIKKTINISKNRALVTARMETQRLEGAAIDTYYAKAEVKKVYDKVYRSRSDARPTHLELNYQVADNEGFFINANGVKFRYPPEPDSPFGCRCRIELVKKQEA